MAGARQKKTVPTLTTAQRLASIVKSARDIMRKDRGLSGDLDRLPVLTWVMFLKFLDDSEREKEEEAAMSDGVYHPTLEAPYRWRDWAEEESGISGDALIAFINQDEVRRPDGQQGKGLFKYLRELDADGTDPRKKVVATVFKDTTNRMVNGYLLRDVVNKINEIHFTSSQEMSTLGSLYETMLKEMRDAAGDSGEFYTPRPVVRFMVEVTDPRIGETVLDPACGTGGFLTAAFDHMQRQCQSVQDETILQTQTLQGVEVKPLPYLLAQMNLLLHGLNAPDVQKTNSLNVQLGQLGDDKRVDVILTNPPFGGEEEKAIATGFPADKRTSETALLFLQLIMRRLRRVPRGGRAAIVVPNGTLFGDGVCAKIKEELLTHFNLHTIVRLPNGVFSPYTSIPSNLLFFERNGKTGDIWYYELTLPEGKKQYTKTTPMRYEEFADCLAWWPNREENEHAWRVPASELIKRDSQGVLVSVNLDVKNPNQSEAEAHRSPTEIIASLKAKEARIAALLNEIEQALAGELR